MSAEGSRTGTLCCHLVRLHSLRIYKQVYIRSLARTLHETFARFLALLEMTRDVLDNSYIITKN